MMLLLATGSDALAQQRKKAEVELVLGSLLASVDSAGVTTSHGSVGVGIGVVAPLHQAGGITLSAMVQPVAGFGLASGLSVDQIHIPVGFRLSTEEWTDERTSPIIGGAIGAGAMLSGSRYAGGRGAADIRPFICADLYIGTFQRGVLRLRYFYALGQYHPVPQTSIGYHGLFIVGTTAW
ncbi:MAG: hypothetical protein J0I17_01895 ['Candidatus Kapabacteria' thiocyanatum]|nr:hypothetical protein ['Candidatus Kapabacteria' thiocyanatum]